VVVLGAKILARLLVVNGPSYVKKFAEKSGGFTIMKHRLKSWWNTPGIWTICFAILFDRDVASIDFERDFDLFNLTDLFTNNPRVKVVYPEVFPVITAMLETGLRAIVKDQAGATSLNEPQQMEFNEPLSSDLTPTIRGRRRTMSLSAKQSFSGRSSISIAV
jgi:beige protein homolog 1